MSTTHTTLSPMEVQMMQMMQTLGRMEGKIDKALEADEAHIKITDDHETRLRLLEKTGWKQMGFVAGVSAVISIIVNYGHKIGVFAQ